VTPSTQISPFRPHPWHGLAVGPEPPDLLNAFIEITPFDLMKYEVDKASGYLRIDRPQRSSSQPPSLYGFVPRTYCHERVRRLAPTATRGDGDPLDICVLSERAIARNEILVRARVIGGLQMSGEPRATSATYLRSWSSGYNTISSPISWCRASRCTRPSERSTAFPMRDGWCAPRWPIMRRHSGRDAGPARHLKRGWKPRGRIRRLQPQSRPCFPAATPGSRSSAA
jgi:inorganic pyrophosphatase